MKQANGRCKHSPLCALFHELMKVTNFRMKQANGKCKHSPLCALFHEVMKLTKLEWSKLMIDVSIHHYVLYSMNWWKWLKLQWGKRTIDISIRHCVVHVIDWWRWLDQHLYTSSTHSRVSAAHNTEQCPVQSSVSWSQLWTMAIHAIVIFWSVVVKAECSTVMFTMMEQEMSHL